MLFPEKNEPEITGGIIKIGKAFVSEFFDIDGHNIELSTDSEEAVHFDYVQNELEKIQENFGLSGTIIWDRN